MLVFPAHRDEPATLQSDFSAKKAYDHNAAISAGIITFQHLRGIEAS